jgi:hypothetical protein
LVIAAFLGDRSIAQPRASRFAVSQMKWNRCVGNRSFTKLRAILAAVPSPQNRSGLALHEQSAGLLP